MTAEMIAAIIALIALVGSMITVWINLNLKIKELTMKIIEIEHKFSDVDKNNDAIIRTIEKNNDKLWSKLDLICEKLDDKFKDLAILQDQHNQMMKSCQKNNKNYD